MESITHPNTHGLLMESIHLLLIWRDLAPDVTSRDIATASHDLTLKVDVPDLVTYLDRTRIFQWYLKLDVWMDYVLKNDNHFRLNRQHNRGRGGLYKHFKSTKITFIRDPKKYQKKVAMTLIYIISNIDCCSVVIDCFIS